MERFGKEKRSVERGVVINVRIKDLIKRFGRLDNFNDIVFLFCNGSIIKYVFKICWLFYKDKNILLLNLIL